MTTKLVSDFTAHNVSTPLNYNATTYPAQTGTQALFTGKTNRHGTVFAIDKTLMDDSQNAASPMVISKESVRNLMPADWPGRIAMHAQVWWGLSSHPNIGFNDQDAATMQAICNDIKVRGYDVFIPDWYHPTKSTVANDTTVDVIATACQSAGLKFMVMIDQQYFDAQRSTRATYQADLIFAINHLMGRYASHPAYEHNSRIGGVSRPLILLWGIASRVGPNVDWNVVRSAVAPHSNPLIIQYQASGFGVTQSDGALAWLDTNADSAGKPVSGVSYLTGSFLQACTANQSKICISSVTKGFNGTLTRNVSWSLNKYLDQQDGFTWLDWWATNRAYVAGGKHLDYVATITLDDFQEGSAVQCGIRTAVKINAGPVAGNVITFSVTGDERTMRQYNLWGSLDGVTVTLLASVLPGATKQFDLTNLPGLVTPGTYTLYVEGQGMPSLENQMAPQTFIQRLSLFGGGTGIGGGPTQPMETGP